MKKEEEEKTIHRPFSFTKRYIPKVIMVWDKNDDRSDFELGLGWAKVDLLNASLSLSRFVPTSKRIHQS